MEEFKKFEKKMKKKEKMKKKKKTGMSVGYLDKLWSKAIKCKWNHRCAICCTTEGLESHHIIHRRQCGVLRTDPENGICLCHKHHSEAETLAVKARILGMVNSDYLADMEVRYKIKADYLREHGLSEAEFRKQRAEELKKYIEVYND